MKKIRTATSPDEQSVAMSFLGHLDELRWRVIKAFIAVGACSVVAYFFWEQIFEGILVSPLNSLTPKPQLVFSTLAEGFTASIKISIYVGLLAASPVVIYQIWRFVTPALYRTERKNAFLLVFVSVLCFIIGISFSFIAIPRMIQFFAAFRTASLIPLLTVNAYIDFIVKLTLAFGVVFQLPAVSLILSRAGIITHKTLLDHWRVAIVIIFVVSAIITPPDVMSQTLMAVPLILLYAISIGIAFLARKKDQGK